WPADCRPDPDNLPVLHGATLLHLPREAARCPDQPCSREGGPICREQRRAGGATPRAGADRHGWRPANRSADRSSSRETSAGEWRTSSMNGGQVMVVLIVAIVMVASIVRAKYGHTRRGASQIDPREHAENMRLREEVKELK